MRLLSGTAGAAMLFVLAGCPGDFSGGYEKVGFREEGQLAMANAPEPPPYIAGFGAGPAEIPTLASAPAGVTQEMVEAGAANYGTVCSACHGPGGAGTPAGPTLADQDWIHVDGSFDQIVGIIQSGVANPVQYPGAMPALGGGNFTPEQVRELAAYILAISQAPA